MLGVGGERDTDETSLGTCHSGTVPGLQVDRKEELSGCYLGLAKAQHITSLGSRHALQLSVFVHPLLSHRTLAGITIRCQPGMGEFSGALKGNSAGNEPSRELQALHCAAQATFLLKL